MPESRESSIRRGIEVLLGLGSDEARDGGIGVTRLAEIVGRDKSQVSRALSVLAEYGLAERIPGERGYRLGWQVHVLSASTGQKNLVEQMTVVMRELAKQTDESAFAVVRRGDEFVVVVAEHPERSVHVLSASTGQKNVVEQMAVVMRELARETEESAFAVVRRGDEYVVVVAEHPERSVHVRGVVGYAAPLLTSGAGRALLADEDREGFDALCERAPARRWTEKTVTDHEAIWERIGRERERGFYVNDEEYESELVSVSAPVRRRGGPVLAAVSTAGPRHRMIERIDEAGREINEAADKVSAALEGEEPPG